MRRSLDPVVEQQLREVIPGVVALLTRRFGDFANAEEAVQDALLAAYRQWPDEGVPQNPAGWITAVAMRRLQDQVRSERARWKREEAFVAEEASDEAGEPRAEDDTLRLLFMCCHPALTPPSAIALTLRAVGGLMTSEIARAFLVPESTMAQRISRAKQSILKAGGRYELPKGDDWASRRASVLHVLYLMFNEGYAQSEGDTVYRVDLSTVSMRLTRELLQGLPDDGEVMGLLALMLLTDARRAARSNEHGHLIPLDEQDRALWNHAQIEEGVALVSRALRAGPVGVYQLQAAIAAIHDEAATPDVTDWPQILALYGLLKLMAPSPVVTLNHAVAAAMVHGPVRGLELLHELDADERMRDSHRLYAVRAHLHEKAGDTALAVEQYRKAAARTANLAERHYLLTRAERLGAT